MPLRPDCHSLDGLGTGGLTGGNREWRVGRSTDPVAEVKSLSLNEEEKKGVSLTDSITIGREG